MALTPSKMIPLGTPCPDFSLPATDGRTISRDDFRDARALVVIFMCNHCPYVKHLYEGLVSFGKDYQEKGVAIVGINSNSAITHPDDSFGKMIEEVKKVGYTFPYLYDETQEVARAFSAACTPDFFVFDSDGKLAYRGQFDDSRPNSDIPVTGRDLRAAVDALLNGSPIAEPQKPSLGCNIKWAPGG